MTTDSREEKTDASRPPHGLEGNGGGGAQELVRRALEEDVGDGDRTTRWTVPGDLEGRARIVARQEGVAAGTELATRAFTLLDSSLEVRFEAEDGDGVPAGAVVARLEGLLAPILTAERTALNFLGRLSGIATLTRRFVNAVRDTGCRITDTRKTTPGWRVLEKAATRAGGAVNHRAGLYDMVLVKENHIRAAGGVGAALDAVRDRARREGLEVEVEVTSLAELDQALDGGPHRILLDNMSVETMREAVDRLERSPEPRPQLEASGGVTLESVRRVARTGVDLISVGALTHSAPALDLSLLVDQGREG